MKRNKFPDGWDEKKVTRVIAHYEHQSQAEAVAEDQAALGKQTETVMQVPKELVPVVRELIAKQAAAKNK